MGLIDSLLKRDKKKEPIEKKAEVETLVIDTDITSIPIPPTQNEAPRTGKLNLSKEIENSFSKLNLDKDDVRSETEFLLDTSGSMNERVDEKRKIEHLRDVMSKYPDAWMLCFSSGVHTINNAREIPNPNGGTDLAHALKYIGTQEKLPKRIVLVSDGEPDSKSGAIKQAEALNIPIDIVFIGHENSDSDDFMKELAQITGGHHFTV